MSLGAEEWQQARAIFEEAMAMEATAWPELLRRRCPAEDLRREVEALLAAHRRAGDFLEVPASLQGVPSVVGEASGGEPPGGDPSGGDPPEDETLDDKPSDDEATWRGRLLGRYRLLRRLGSGGMGDVFLAERADGEVQQQVALKVLRSGFSNADLHGHFNRERQILALLEHPSIARFLDAGRADDGTPFLVMEHVAGQAVDMACRGLSLDERLRLFRRVLEAVAYAHRHLVVHRDIKPSNILITAEGLPKLLDFGIAKLLQPNSEETATRWHPMTLDFASPEQVKGEAISTASDVYSLGVLLYQLLSGRRPFVTQLLSPPEWMRLICDVEPPPPSVAVLAPVSGEDSHLETLEPRQARQRSKQLTGDLDRIVAKALAKDAAQRYASVERFDDDLRCYLEGLPVSARAPSWGYRLGKFLRRRRWPVAMVSSLVLASLIFAVVMAWQRHLIVQERDRAHVQQRRAEQVRAFVVDLFEASDPFSQVDASDLDAHQILDRGASKLRGRLLAEQPEVRADLFDTVAFIYLQLSELEAAEPLVEEAVALRRQVADDPAGRARSEEVLGMLRFQQGHYDAAETAFAGALAMLPKNDGSDGASLEDEARLLGHLASVAAYRGQLDLAEERFRRALELDRGVSPDRADHLQGLALVMQIQGELATSADLYRQALAAVEAAHGTGSLQAAVVLGNLASLHLARGRIQEAEAVYRQVLGILLAQLGEEHVEVAKVRQSLATTLESQERLGEAADLYRRALPSLQHRLGTEHPLVANVLHRLGCVHRDLGDLGVAEGLLGDALEMRRRTLGESHPMIVVSLNDLASLRLLQGEAAEAESLARQAIELTARVAPEHWRRYDAESALGASLAVQGRFDAAEVVLLGAVAGLQEQRGDTSRQTLVAMQRLIDLYEQWQRPGQAEPWRRQLADARAERSRPKG